MSELIPNKTLTTNDNIEVGAFQIEVNGQTEKYATLIVYNGWEQAECRLTKECCRELIETLEKIEVVL